MCGVCIWTVESSVRPSVRPSVVRLLSRCVYCVCVCGGETREQREGTEGETGRMGSTAWVGGWRGGDIQGTEDGVVWERRSSCPCVQRERVGTRVDVLRVFVFHTCAPFFPRSFRLFRCAGRTTQSISLLVDQQDDQ